VPASDSHSGHAKESKSKWSLSQASNMMKIVFVAQYYDQVLPPDQNSVGIWTYEVASRLADKFETTIIARRMGPGPSRVRINGVNIELLKCLSPGIWGKASRLWSRTLPGAKPLFAQSFYALEFIRQATKRIREIAPAVIHLQNFPQFAAALRVAAPDAAIVLHMHCDWLDQLDRKAMARGIAAADLVAGCSSHVIEPARERFAAAATDFAVLPNGAPDYRLAGVAAQRVAGKVIFVGRLSPEKGLHTLLEAWPKVVAACPWAHLDIVGPSAMTPREFLVDLSDDTDVRALSRFYAGKGAGASYTNALRAMIPADIAHTVSFIGYEAYERVIDRCASSAVLVNPSLSESFGMSLIEAMATGTPVIATRAGGMPEIVEATRGGLLVEKNDPAALASAIVQVLNDPQSSAGMGQCGAKAVAKLYPWARIAALTRQFHNQALMKRRRQAAEMCKMNPHDALTTL